MNHLKFIFFTFAAVFSFGFTTAYGQQTTVSVPDKIQWISFEQAIELSKTHPKKIFIDVYTDWCGWCKRMDKSTFADSGITKLMNEDFYAVKFNAESKTPIEFRDKKFEFKDEYRAHELAISLLDGKMSYPSCVYLDEDFNLLTRVPGYLTPDQLGPILNYFGKNIYKEKKWEEYTGSAQ